MKRGNIFQNLQQVYLTARNNFLQCLRKLFEKLTYQWNLRLATALSNKEMLHAEHRVSTKETIKYLFEK